MGLLSMCLVQDELKSEIALFDHLATKRPLICSIEINGVAKLHYSDIVENDVALLRDFVKMKSLIKIN